MNVQVNTSSIIKALIDDKLCLVEAINRKDEIIDSLKSEIEIYRRRLNNGR